MATNIVEIVNAIPNIADMSYLELGVWVGINHSKINAGYKVSVDIDMNPTYKMTTDEYFAKYKQVFDVIFIDADHHVEQVLKDYNNSILVCRRALLIHDLWPSDPRIIEGCNGTWTGDGYKLLNVLLVSGHNAFVLDRDQGLTLVLPPFKPVGNVPNISFVDFEAMRHKRISPTAMKELLCK